MRAAALLLALSACHQVPTRDCSPDRYTDYAYEHAGAYVPWGMSYGARTPLGAWVDTSGHAVDLARLDELTRAAERCLGMDIVSCSLRVKVAEQYTREEDGREWFWCEQPWGKAKCTGVIQFPATIITTPSLASYQHELAHVVLHAGEGDPRLLRCEHAQ